MGWEGIGTLIGTISSWWTPEKVKARARSKLNKLEEKENDLFKREATPKNVAYLKRLRRDIKRLQDYLQAD